MLTNNFYSHSIRKVTANFGSLFNEIEFVKDDTVSPPDTFTVPISFAPRTYFISRLNEKSSIDNEGRAIVQHTLPTMTFEISGYEYAKDRQTNLMISIPETENPTSPVQDSYKKTQFNLVPYDITFTLNVFARKYEDLLQIMEQILPYFAPKWNLNVVLNDFLNIQKTIPVVLNSVSLEDEYQNQYSDFRLLNQQLEFTAQSFIMPPITEQEVIKEVKTNMKYNEDPHGNLDQFIITEDDV